MAASPPRAIAFAIHGPIARAHLPELCGRLSALLAGSGADVALCDVSALDADAVTIDALARLQLTARRHRCKVRLCDASTELLELVAFTGLRDVLRTDPTSDELSQRRRSQRANPLLRKEEAMASGASQKLFVNLPVKDLDRSVEFFTKLGFSFDPRFTDEQAACMIVGDEAFVMLLVENRFKDFTTKPISDAAAQTETILAVSAESREQVDELVDKALEAGAGPANDPVDQGFMYGRSFQDPDGHLWEAIWMDASVIEEQGAATRGP